MAQTLRFYQLCAALVAGLLVNTSVFFGEIRFRAPLDPLLLILLAVGIVKVGREIKGRDLVPRPSLS